MQHNKRLVFGHQRVGKQPVLLSEIPYDLADSFATDHHLWRGNKDLTCLPYYDIDGNKYLPD
jgi:hypothetical protein